jgi:hypothetical protein
MTPQEKAKQLFGKYAMYLRANLRYDEEADEDAKQCALIAVDEILEDQMIQDGMRIEYPQYWIEVKREIEKL